MKKENQRKEDQLVVWITRVEGLKEAVNLRPQRIGLIRIWWKCRKQTLGHRQYGRRENHRDHTAHIDLQRHCGLLTAQLTDDPRVALHN